jgi:ubiquitin carboxyl-terminal hydrolase L5
LQAMSSDWCTIESDPGVFTQLIETVGVKGVQVEDLYTLDDGVTSELQPIYGLVFLFKWIPGSKDTRVTCSPDDVYFAQQVVVNACATQAILSILLNSRIDIGPTLSEFKNITAEFSPEMKGLSIGNQPVIKQAHNSFARHEPFHFEETKGGKAEDAFHFVSYVHVNGRLYELDGLKPGPIDLGECTEENWVSVATPIIQARMDSFAQAEIKFSLLAVVKNRIELFEERLAVLRQEQTACESKLETMGDMETDEKTNLIQELEIIKDKIDSTHGFIAGEKIKHANWKAENIRRRHNYIPFLFNLLKVLAEKDLLVPLIERAKEKQRLRDEKK